MQNEKNLNETLSLKSNCLVPQEESEIIEEIEIEELNIDGICGVY
jgi:mycofactocin precursor